MRHQILFSIAAFSACLVSSCSHPSSGPADNGSGSAAPAAPAAQAARPYGIKVDSLDGIPGHRFGEPLSTFPGLVAGEVNADGMRLYYYPSTVSNQGRGWFSKHHKELVTSYYFVDGKFAYFAVTAYGEYRRLLSDEATYLFGPGERFQLTGTIWQGSRARAMYTVPFMPQGPSVHLEVVSEPLEAQQKQRAAAKLKAENDAP